MIKVGIVGYGTIGKRVADAVQEQPDMKLVGVTANSFNYRIVVASKQKIPIYALGDHGALAKHGIKVAGQIEDLLENVDIIVDCAPKPCGAENIEKYYKPYNVKAILQGGEKAHAAQASFNAQSNYNECINLDYVRVVSCNTTGLARTLNALNQAYGIERANVTLIRRATDPMDSKKGPINAIVPCLELPSHHGPDVKTVIKDLNIMSTAVVVPTTLMHLHSVHVVLKKETTLEQVKDVFNKTRRVILVRASEKILSTAEICELARDLGNKRGDMMDICVWEEGIGVQGNEVFYMQAVHQESDVVPENIDCIRAMMGFKDANKSIQMTNKALGIYSQ